MATLKVTLIASVLIVCVLSQTALRPKIATCRKGTQCRKATVKTTIDKVIYCCQSGFTRISASSTDINGKVTKSCKCYGEP
nr:hypothetical protein BgiMline_010541 [Biomphalaria glabrata]